MGDPRGDPQTSPQHADPHGFLAFLKKQYKKSMWIGVLWAGLRAAMWITHVDHPCGGQISPWPARKVTEKMTLLWKLLLTVPGRAREEVCS